MDTPNRLTKKAFQSKMYTYYRKNKRSLPWRETRDPYKVLVSELMLQQTQAPRVIPKYKAFLKKFPTIKVLATASTREVLEMWQGLGYNRRALYLSRIARTVVKHYKGIFPKTYEELCALPGIGPYTASAIMVFAYEKSQVLIETNIRAVFIHFFFPKSKKIPDTKLLPLIGKYMDSEYPKEWYNALMDYGVFLKMTIPNPSRKSKHHTRQSTFKGSIREVRGAIIRSYTVDHTTTKRSLIHVLPYAKEIIEREYDNLKNEGFFA